MAGGVSRILFVDDDPDVLAVLREVVALLNPQWETEFVASAAEALAVLERRPSDVLVTDMRMPGMDGAELLAEVRRRHPSVVRVVLSGQTEDITRFRSVDSAHQYVTKPIDPEALWQTLARACALPDLLADVRLKQVVARMGSLPSVPAVYLKLQEACRLPDVSSRTLAEIIAQDAAMTTKILQMVNSGFFGLRRRVTSPFHAVQLLGQDTVKALTLSASVFFGCDPLRLKLCSMESQWSHSLLVSTMASRIAELEGGDHQSGEDARVGGLLHDLGTLVFAASMPGAYSQVVAAAKERGVLLWEAEMETFGVSHGAVGAYLLGLWGLPEALVEAVAFHHAPRRCLGEGLGLLTLVHAADALAHELHPEHVIGGATCVDPEYLAKLGLGHRLPAWREACRATAESTAAAAE